MPISIPIATFVSSSLASSLVFFIASLDFAALLSFPCCVYFQISLCKARTLICGSYFRITMVYTELFGLTPFLISLSSCLSLFLLHLAVHFHYFPLDYSTVCKQSKHRLLHSQVNAIWTLLQELT